MTEPRPFRRGTTLIVTALIVSACGGGGSESAEDGAVIRTAGDITVEQDDLADTDESSGDDSGAAGAAEGDGTTDDGGDSGGTDGDGSTSGSTTSTTTSSTLPQNEESGGEVGALLDALEIFNECLLDKDVEFIGIPGQAGGDTDPDNPVNAPEYLTALGECAAVSNIINVMQEAQAANESLTDPVEIEDRNRGLVAWAECMEGRGWTVELTANANGLLSPQPTPPEGESLMGSDDLRECADQAQAETDS